MKRHHNTLYVTTQGSYLASEGETVVVRVEQEDRARLPLHLLEGIVCFGRVSASPQLMAACSQRGVAISFLSEHGRFLARVVGPVSGNVLLRREQYRRADSGDYSAIVAQAMVTAKVANCRTVLQRSIRDHGDDSGRVSEAVDALARILHRLQEPMDLESVRGAEGDAARTYFAVFDYLIVAQKDAFFFHQRTRRPPLDNVNALLSFVYTLLTHDARSALEAVGLDPQVGFLHRDRPGARAWRSTSLRSSDRSSPTGSSSRSSTVGRFKPGVSFEAKPEASRWMTRLVRPCSSPSRREKVRN